MVLSNHGRTLLWYSSNPVFCLRIGSPIGLGDFLTAYIAIGSLEGFSSTTSFCGLALADAAWAAECEGDLIGTGWCTSCCLIDRGAGPFFMKKLLPAAAAAAAAAAP
jgi:hypothetical protein